MRLVDGEEYPELDMELLRRSVFSEYLIAVRRLASEPSRSCLGRASVSYLGVGILEARLASDAGVELVGDCSTGESGLSGLMILDCFARSASSGVEALFLRTLSGVSITASAELEAALGVVCSPDALIEESSPASNENLRPPAAAVSTFSWGFSL